MTKWNRAAWVLAATLAAAGCGNTSISEIDTISNPPNPGVETLLPEERLGIHLSPAGAMADDVDEIAPLVGLIRTQLRPDVKNHVGNLIDGAPASARFLLILAQDDLDLDFVRRFANDPKVVGWELENEPENFLGWTAQEYVDFVKGIAPAVREAAGPGKRIVAAATRPMVQDFPRTLDYNRDMIRFGLLEQVDVYNMHVYSKQYEKLPAIEEVYAEARNRGKEVWVTEVGENNRPEQLNYFLQVTEVYRRLDIDPDRWVIYAWNDDTLGYSLRSPEGADGPLLDALQARNGG